MQHGIVWSRSAEANEIWESSRSSNFEDFCIEVLTFFLSGTGLQELYVQLELMQPQHWDFLAEVAALARKEVAVLSDAHPIGGNPVEQEAYGGATKHISRRNSNLIHISLSPSPYICLGEKIHKADI